jgi:intracellular sulfur oxidation DsrE/DsrF family protein
MAERHSRDQFARRTFLSKLGLGLTTGGAALGGSIASAQSQPGGSGGRWQAARHAQDDWFDQVPGKHRYVFDTTTPAGFADALLFVTNYFNANQTGYGLQDADLAIVVVARHRSTLFAYKDAVWAKYGGPITARTNFNDPKTNRPPTINLFNSTEYGNALGNRGNTVDGLVKRGIHLAVCQVSTRANSAAIAEATGQKAEAVYDELVANLVSRTAHIVPAGIIAVNRAQERGYSLVTAG